MVCANRLGELSGPLPGLAARVLGAHEGGVEDALGKFLGCLRDPLRALLLPADAPGIADDQLVAGCAVGNNQAAHRVYDRRSRAAVDAAAQRKEVPRHATAPPEVVPQPTRRAQRNLFLGLVVSDLYLLGRPNGGVQIGAVARQTYVRLDARVDGVVDGLHPSRRLESVAPHVLQVHRRRHNLDIPERELRALRHNLSVHPNHRTAVVVEPVAVAALLVGIQIDAAADARRVRHELYPPVQLPQLVMAPGRVGQDLDSIQRHARVRCAGREQLLAGLSCNARVDCRDCRVAERHFSLPRDLLHHPGQVVLLDVALTAPWREITHLAVVAIVGKKELGPYQEYLLIEGNDAAVVADVLVRYRPIKRTYPSGSAVRLVSSSL